MSIEGRAARITLVLFDVDGVLTDGKILLSGYFDSVNGTPSCGRSASG